MMRCAAFLAAFWVSAGSVSGQDKAPPAFRPAFVNVGQVFQQSAKAKEFRDRMEGSLAPLKKDGAELNRAMQELQNRLTAPDTTPEERESIVGQMTEKKRKLEALDQSARTLIGKLQEGLLIELFRDMRTTARRLAEEKGFHAVLAYGDLPSDADPFTLPNVQRLMQGLDKGSAAPLFVAPEFDLTRPVLEAMNADHARKGKKAEGE